MLQVARESNLTELSLLIPIFFSYGEDGLIQGVVKSRKLAPTRQKLFRHLRITLKHTIGTTYIFINNTLQISLSKNYKLQKQLNLKCIVNEFNQL